MLYWMKRDTWTIRHQDLTSDGWFARKYKNSSWDEIANVSFFYDDIIHVKAAPTPIEPTSWFLL